MPLDQTPGELRPFPRWIRTAKGPFRLLLENFHDAAQEMYALSRLHFAESDPLAKDFPLDASFPYYLDRADKGRVAIIMARDEGLRAVGYLVFRIDRSAHCTATTATEELWFIHPEARGTHLAKAMIEYFEYIARELKINEIYMGYSKKDASALYERAGLSCVAVVYGKVLK